MAKAMRYFNGRVERETERAILVRFCVGADAVYDGDGNVHSVSEYSSVWLPKSQVEVYARLRDADGDATVWKVPLWLCNKNHLCTITKKIADELAVRFAA